MLNVYICDVVYEGQRLQGEGLNEILGNWLICLLAVEKINIIFMPSSSSQSASS